MPPLEIRTLSLARLKPAEYNPRRVTAKARAKLKASLEKFGLVEPLIWNETTGHIVGGHQRLELLRELGYAEVPVSVVRLDANREKALNVVLNNREAQGQFDSARLSIVLEELRDLSLLPDTGFDPGVFQLLNFEPMTEIAELNADRVEVTLAMGEELFASVRPKLDALIAQYDLECHVRRGVQSSAGVTSIPR